MEVPVVASSWTLTGQTAGLWVDLDWSAVHDKSLPPPLPSPPLPSPPPPLPPTFPPSPTSSLSCHSCPMLYVTASCYSRNVATFPLHGLAVSRLGGQQTQTLSQKWKARLDCNLRHYSPKQQLLAREMENKVISHHRIASGEKTCTKGRIIQ